MARHLDNEKSVQAQLNEIRELQARLELLTDELKNYMDENDINTLRGETTCYKRTWINDSLIFDSTRFKEENANLYERYKTKEKAGYYRYKEDTLK